MAKINQYSCSYTTSDLIKKRISNKKINKDAFNVLNCHILLIKAYV